MQFSLILFGWALRQSEYNQSRRVPSDQEVIKPGLLRL